MLPHSPPPLVETRVVERRMACRGKPDALSVLGGVGQGVTARKNRRNQLAAVTTVPIGVMSFLLEWETTEVPQRVPFPIQKPEMEWRILGI